MMIPDEKLLARQRHAMEHMDLAAAWEIMQEGGAEIRPDDQTLTVALHKARVESTYLSPIFRMISVEWLRSHGYSRRGGIPLPPPGVMPV